MINKSPQDNGRYGLNAAQIGDGSRGIAPDAPNNSSDVCTLLPGPANLAKCVQPGIASEPLYGDCRWKTRNLDAARAARPEQSDQQGGLAGGALLPGYGLLIRGQPASTALVR